MVEGVAGVSMGFNLLVIRSMCWDESGMAGVDNGHSRVELMRLIDLDSI